MKIIFFGLGSIGKRHALILQNYYSYQLFAFRSDKNSNKNPLGIKEIFSWSEVKKLKPDLAFITNPTSLHIQTSLKCAKLGCKLFIEKPIGIDTTSLSKLIKIVQEKNLTTYVSYHLRFHPVITELKKYLKKNKPLYARIVCSSFLPNWRPGTNHLKSYSANSKMGGGVVLDLSHEIDYANFLFGQIENLHGNFAKVSSITKDAEDFADLMFKTETLPVNIHLNFLSHVKQRYIQLEFGDKTIIADILNSKIDIYKNNKLKLTRRLDYYQGQEYASQLKYFFKNIKNPSMMNNLIEAANLFKKIVSFKKQNG